MIWNCCNLSKLWKHHLNQDPANISRIELEPLTEDELSPANGSGDKDDKLQILSFAQTPERFHAKLTACFFTM